HTFTVTFDPKSKYVKAPTRKRVKVTVKSRAAFAGDGVFIVGVDVKPGLYLSRGNTAESCYWKRMSDFSGTIAANDIGYGNRYVQILATDKLVETADCEDFIPAPTTKSPTTAIPGDGMYRVGYDLTPGIYRSQDTGELCYWSRLRNASREGHIIDNDLGYGRRIVQVEASDMFLETIDYGAWTKIG